MSFEMTTLGEYIKVQGGYAYKSKDFIEFSKNKVLKIKNVRFGIINYAEPAYVSDEIAESTKNWKVKEGDVLISMTGSGPNAPQSLVGRVARVWKNEPNALINQRVGRICLLDEDIIHLDFVFYWLSLPQSQEYLVSNSSGSANQANISGKIIESLPCPKVDYQTSKQIADLARKFDEKAILNSKTNQTLEEMAQAIFKSWFVDFDPVKAKMKGEQPEGMDSATASLFPEKLVESELGLIPKGWEASKLENLVDIASSKRVFAKEYLEEGVPFYRGKEITELSKGNSVTPEIYISEERYQELKDKAGAPKEGDILITSVGTIGNTYLVDSDDKFYFKDGNLTWVKDYKGEEIPYFLMEWFKSAVGKCAIENIKIGSTQQAITIKSLNGIKLVNPSNDVHNNFTKLIEPLYRKHRANIKQSKALANLRDTLLPKFLSGEIELGEVEEQAEVN